jgi:DeoR/GlpR family transcriptional regulator of sugar metabolism
MLERALQSAPKGRRRRSGPRGGQGMPAQLASSRRRVIGTMVADRGVLTVSELAACFGVSSMTIRRDLEHLQRSGTIERAHGGALRPTSLPAPPIEPSFLARRTENATAKARIAEAAAALIEVGEVVALDVGSSVVALAEVLRTRVDLGVVTHNLHVVATLAWAETGPSLYVLGGHCRRNEGSLCGPQADAELAQLWLDTAFIGVAGLSPEGLFDYAPEEAEIKVRYRSRARRVVVLCDASKLGRRSLVRVAGLDAVDILVTDVMPSGPLATALAEAGVRVVVAASDQNTVETAQAWVSS